jgi:hypothetical protein
VRKPIGILALTSLSLLAIVQGYRPREELLSREESIARATPPVAPPIIFQKEGAAAPKPRAPNEEEIAAWRAQVEATAPALAKTDAVTGSTWIPPKAPPKFYAPPAPPVDQVGVLDGSASRLEPLSPTAISVPPLRNPAQIEAGKQSISGSGSRLEPLKHEIPKGLAMPPRINPFAK